MSDARESTTVPGVIGAPLMARAEAERVLTSAWCEMLETDTVGRNDNFFDIGGDSVMLIALHNRLEDLFEREIALLDMVRFPTVSSFAAALTGTQAGPHPPRPLDDILGRIRV